MADQKQLPSSSLRPRTADASLGNEIRPWSDMQTRQLTVRGDLDVVGDMTVTGLAQSSFQTLQAKTLESIEEIGPFVDAQGNPIGESVTEVSNRTNLRSNVTQVPGPTTVPTQAAVVGYVTDRINDLQVGDPTFQGEVTFTDKIVVSDETTGNTATLTGNTFSGISENANTWTHPREIDVDGLMKSQPVSVDGSQNETIQLQINWANRQGSKEPNVQDPSDFMFADDPYPQTITSEKTWTQNIKFDPPNATYGIEGGWAEQWKNDLTLSLYDEVEGQVNFNGSEGAVKMRARLNDSFAVIPNVRLYVSAESGSDENPGDSMHRPVRTIKRAAEIARTYVERRKGPFPNFTITNFPPAAVNNPGKGSYADAADAFWGFDDNPRGQTKQNIIDAVDAWFENNEDTDISTLYAQTIDVPGFDTVGDICKRDAGFLIDAVANDLTYGGHKNMARAAAAYYATFKKPFASGGSKSGTDRLVIPESQRAATLAVWDRLRYEINERISGPSFEDARTVVDALFAGFTNTITDPLPIQANFPMEARGSVGGHAVLASAIGDAALRAGWVAETMAYMQEDHASTHAVIGAQMEQDIDAVLQAIAADLNAGGIVQTANALRVYFSNNVPTLAEEHVHPVALTYAALERTVLASVTGIDTSSARQALAWLLDGVRTTVQFPGTFAATPVVIFVATGNYVEKPPIYLPPDTSIVGDSLRSVILTADKTNELDRTDFFHCCSGVYMTNLRFKEIRSPGFCAAFPAALVGIQVGGDELSDPNDAQSERAFFPVVSPNGSGNANVLFSYPGYSKFHPPTVYVDEPRTSDSIVDRFILLRDGFGYTESEKNAIDGWVTDGTIKVRDVRERSNVKRDGNNEVIVDANTGLEEYFDEDDADPNWTGRYPGIPDRRAVFSIVWVETGGVYAIERIELTTDSSTGRPNHGKGYRGQAAFLDLPAPASANGSGAEVLVQMKSDYAEMVVPAEGIDENGRITQVDIVYPGSGYTDNSAPWVSIAAPTDLQPYVVASPYVQNCSNLSGPFLSNGALVPKTMPLPFDPQNVFGDGIGVANLAGGGIRVDGACVKPRSPVPSFVTDAFTQLNQGGIGFLLVNRGYAQLVSTFGVFCSTHVKALGGSFANISNTVTDFGDEGLHARGYWPVPYATAEIVPPRVLVDDGTPRFVPIGSEPATEHPLKLGAGAYLPDATEEGLGVFVPQQGYRSEVLVNAPSTLWGSGFTEEVVVPGGSPLVVSGLTSVNAYLRVEISRPDVLDVGSSTARFVADRYEIQVDGTWKLLEIDETTGVWTVEGDTNVDRTSRVRAFFELNELNVREGEVSPWSLGLDYTQGDIRVDYSTGELTDAIYEGQVTRFTGSGYKRSPTVSVTIVDANFNDITGSVTVDVFPSVALQVSRVTPVVVRLDAESVARLIQPKFMSVCRINGIWHTIRSINRVRGEDVLSSSFAPGEYALTLFPAANWVNEGEIEFFDASYVSTNSHSMEYVGSGITYNALPEYGGVPDRAKEIVQFSPGRVFFTIQDQLGNTRIGSQFEVDQLSGQVTINTDQFNLAGLNALGPFRTEEGATVGVQLREVSDDPNLTSASGAPGNTVPTQAAILQYFERFGIPAASTERLYLQSRDVNGSIRFVWETLRAADLVDDFGKIPMNVFPEQLTIDQSITTGDLTATGDTSVAGSTTMSGNASVSGAFTATNEVVLGSNQHATTVVGDLDVSGGTIIGPVDINSPNQPLETTLYGDATVSGKVTSETLQVDGVVDLGTSTDITTVRGKLKVDGDTEMEDDLVCKQDVVLERDTFVNRVRWRGSANRPTVIDDDGRVPWARLKNYTTVTAGTHLDGGGSVSGNIVLDVLAESENEAGRLVVRDSQGNFSATTVTADLDGNASTASQWKDPRTISLSGDVTGTAQIDGSGNVDISASISGLSGGNFDVSDGGTGRSSLPVNKVLVGNDASAVESPNLLHYDLATNRLGVGTNNPQQRLDVVGDVGMTGTLVSGTVPADRVPDASTSAKGVVQLSTSTDSTNAGGWAATPSAVKAANDNATAANNNATAANNNANTRALASRVINTTAPLRGGGNLTTNRTLTVDDATPNAKGVVQLTNSVSSTSTTMAATPSAVKAANDNATAANNNATAANNNANTRALASRVINTTAPLRGGGNLTTNRTLTVDDATPNAKGVVQLLDSVNSASNSLAATPNAVRVAYNAATGDVDWNRLTNRPSLKPLESDSIVRTSDGINRVVYSKAGNRFTLRDADDNNLFSITEGVIVEGEVPWNRLTNVPNLSEYSTSAEQSETNFPIGHVIWVISHGSFRIRNQNYTLYISSDGTDRYTSSSSIGSNSLAGTWRARGAFTETSEQFGGFSGSPLTRHSFLAQRVA